MDNTTEILTSNIRVVAIDETKHWDRAIQSVCGKIETVYIYDASVQTNLCELTPSYYLIPLYYIIENEVSEEAQDLVDENFANEEPSYYHCRQVDAMKTVATDQNIEFESSDSDEYKEHFDEVEEYCKCNHQI